MAFSKTNFVDNKTVIDAATLNRRAITGAWSRF